MPFLYIGSRSSEFHKPLSIWKWYNPILHYSFEFFLLSICLSVKFLFKYQNTPLNWWIRNITRGRCLCLKEMLFVLFVQKKTSLRSLGLKWCWNSGGTCVLVPGSSSGAARKEGQVGVAEFWFSGNSRRALEGGSRKGDQLMGRMPGLTWFWITCTSLLSQSGSAPQVNFLLLCNVQIVPRVCGEVCDSFQGALKTFVTNYCIS